MAIYLVQAGDGGPIKIGFSGKPFARISAIQAHQHIPIKILGIVDGDLAKEKELHQKFGHLHWRGEWFNPGAEIMEFVASLPPAPIRKESKKFTLTHDPVVRQIWFDLSIDTDVAAAKLIGRNVAIIKRYLGKSGRCFSADHRRRVAKLGADASPVTKLRDDRMPLTEAIKFLYDVNFTIREAIALINHDRRYRRKWTLSYAYQRNRTGDIKLPQRIAGPKLKRT